MCNYNYNIIHEFTVSLLDDIMKGNTISFAFKRAEEDFKTKINNFIKLNMHQFINFQTNNRYSDNSKRNFEISSSGK